MEEPTLDILSGVPDLSGPLIPKEDMTLLALVSSTDF